MRRLPHMLPLLAQPLHALIELDVALVAQGGEIAVVRLDAHSLSVSAQIAVRWLRRTPRSAPLAWQVVREVEECAIAIVHVQTR